MFKRYSCLVILLFLCGCGRENETVASNAGGNVESFAPGQTWTYKTRAGEESLRIIICRVDTDPKIGEIVHIHMNGLRMKKKHAPGGVGNEIGHMPYESAALRKTVTALESSNGPIPDYKSGYQDWKTAFDNGEAGVFTASVSEVMAGMESALNQ